MFWRKKRRPKSDLSDQDIIGGLIQEFWDSGDLDPVYIHGLDNEDEANAHNWQDLPLIYLWNEHFSGDDVGYSLSINGPLVGLMLEAAISREDPNFEALRDKAIATIRDVSMKSVSSTCASTGMTPAKLFSK